MGYPQISYQPVAGVSDLVLLDFKRGPGDFICQTAIRAKDNLSTSGKRERVLEAQDLLITFTMPAVYIYEDYPAWSAFAEWAMDGVYFNFAPNSDFAGLLHCVSNDTTFTPSHKGVGRYEFNFNWQIVPDPLCPLNPGVVMQMFYGNAGLIIVPATLPAATVGAAYSQQLNLGGPGSKPWIIVAGKRQPRPGFTGTEGDYAWNVAASALPAGLTLSSTGLISGTPTAAGSSCFLIGVVVLGTDSLPIWTVLQIADLTEAGFRAYSLVVNA
jgi:hypothetical protein